MQNTIHGLIKTRGEIAGQHKVALRAADNPKADLDAIDRALVPCGYQDDPKGIAPRRKHKQLFGRNGLKREQKVGRVVQDFGLDGACGGWPRLASFCLVGLLSFLDFFGLSILYFFSTD